MTFDEIVQETQRLPLKEVRKNTEGYFECVINVEHEKNLCTLLEHFFGPPFKPKNITPSGDCRRYTHDYGGIEKHQVLYYFERDSLSHCALIWPWNNGEQATVKLAQGRIR